MINLLYNIKLIILKRIKIINAKAVFIENTYKICEDLLGISKVKF